MINMSDQTVNKLMQPQVVQQHFHFLLNPSVHISWVSPCSTGFRREERYID